METIEKAVYEILKPSYTDFKRRFDRGKHTVPKEVCEKLKIIETSQEGENGDDDYEEESVITSDTSTISFYPHLGQYRVLVGIDGEYGYDFPDFSREFQLAVLSYFEELGKYNIKWDDNI